MAEADITEMAAKADGAAWGPAGRGAFATLQTRLKPGDVPAASTTVAGLIEIGTDAEILTGTSPTLAVTPSGLTARLRAATAMVVSTHSASGSYTINWANGRHFRVNATANITAIAESSAPAAAAVIQGTLEVVNTGASSITVDSTALAYGLDGVVTIPAGGREMILLTSTGA